MDGQASIEYMMLFGVSLVIVAILWTVSSSNITDTTWDLQRAYAKNALDRIVQTADIAYVQGAPTQIYIMVDFPDNIQAIYIKNDTVTMELRWKDLLRNISAYSATNLTGSIAPSPGRHKLLVKAGNLVDVSDA